MLVAEFDPATGWSAPEIKPYAPLSLDPMSSCLHYSTNVFEGMKVSGIYKLFVTESNAPKFRHI